MRSSVRTTIATYFLLSIAGGVSFVMPDSLETPPPPRPIPRAEPPATRTDATDIEDDGADMDTAPAPAGSDTAHGDASVACDA